MRKTVLKHLSSILSGILRTLFMALTFGLLFIAVFKKDWILQFLAFIETGILSIGYWNYPLAFAFAIIESFPVLGVFFPGMQAMLLVGGFFGRAHLLEMIAVSALGAVIGNFAGYALGKHFGKTFFRNYGDIFGIGKTELSYLERQIAKNGPWFVVFGKFHNFTRSFVPFIAGSLDMHPKRFWAYNVIGSIFWATTIITLGVVFAAYYQEVVRFFGYILFGLFAIFWAYIALFRRKEFSQYLEAKRREMEERTL